MTTPVRKILKNLNPPPTLTISEWADRFRYLPQESSAEPGRWRTDRAPYQRGIMDAIASHREVVVQSSSQIGKSEILNNCLGYFVDLDPAPILMLQPTLEMAEAFSKDRIATMIRDSPTLRPKFKDPRSRDSNNMLLYKKFPGGYLALAGANSPASLASRPIRVLLCDEIDRYPASAGTEGDPVNLARKRTATFYNSVVLLVSTPGLKGVSRIEAAFERSDKRHYFVPCPHCGQEQALVWERFVYPGRETANPDCVAIAYRCAGCDQLIEEGSKAWMLANGTWRPTAESHIAGFHIWEAYSPWRRWQDIALDFEAARGDTQLLQVFVNTSLGLPYEAEDTEGLEWQRLAKRAQAETYRLGTVPVGGLVLVAGVDVQGDRLEFAVWAYGKDEEAWLVDYQQILGSPIEPDTWTQLQAALTCEYPHATGARVRVRAVCVDTGYQTQEVYAQVRKRKALRWYAVKGKAGDRALVSRPTAQEINHQGKVVKRGVQLYTVGVDLAKATLYARSHLDEGARSIHFPADIDTDILEGFCSEVQTVKHRAGVAYTSWQKINPSIRNEPLDVSVYALAAAYLVGISRLNWDKEAETLAATIAPPEETKTTKQQPPKGWVNSW
ncbi:MAG: hypothetical protein DDT26_00131 [Dehalococcoidia bacterium]|nr:hypothetical protein [Chloroflexota bacterium]